ncbi:UDP-N-acetylmuramoyl-tripeptide--D-alanyl-D-alanine ligase [Leptobacterium sp. I13]|uniref:UDP-N-acetylmuramoyl-tripeptide--D-alanyl-D- alanine ligase n=1 Tax=Leptobacterium meishanense TaxID=3128904 RepID=UPI0030EBBD72
MMIQDLYTLFLDTRSVCTDTRKIEKNCLFFALKGTNFNGNQFAKEALKKGASYAIVDEKKYEVSGKTILVDDVLTTLQKLANYHRKQLKTTIIALTGSNGKTTTKELINCVLKSKYNTIATKGNLNNHIGVPLTLLSIKYNIEIAIVEMGANHQKEIAFLCEITFPDYGCITNFGKAHLEGFGGIEGVIKGKSELYDHLIEQNKHIFYNTDDPIQVEKLKNYSKKISYSKSGKADYVIEFVGANPFVTIKVGDTYINSQLIGSYNYSNIALAITIGMYFDVPLSAIKKAVENYIPANNRSQILYKNSNKIILDAYNANPTSMVAAFDHFSNLPDKNKIAFLGDMFELGEDSNKEHQAIVDIAEKAQGINVILIGTHFYKTNSTLEKYKTFNDLRKGIDRESIKNSTILIKGSRGMALERILDVL